MKHVNLIFSGEYISASLQAEFGRIIPCLLPVGNQKLIEHQILSLPTGPTVVTVPQDLDNRSVNSLLKFATIEHIEKTRTNESLITSIMKMFDHYRNLGFETYSLIMGDTLIEDFSWHPNVYSSHKSYTNYYWTGAGSKTENVFSGYINMSRHQVDELLAKYSIGLKGMVIEDLLLDIQPSTSGKWYDFGHYHNYHISKKDFISKRYFNSFETTEFSLIKRSSNKLKMRAESSWYENVPTKLKYHCPTLYSVEDGMYEIEHLYANSLSEIFVHGKLPEKNWDSIKDRLFALLATLYSLPAQEKPRTSLKDFVVRKTIERLTSEELPEIGLETEYYMEGVRKLSLKEMMLFAADFWPDESDGNYKISHGDFCFSNILYDARSMKLSVIDPRGLDSSEAISPNGYFEYDVAKLAHSMIYGYDFIIAGQVKTEILGNVLTSDYKDFSFMDDSQFWLKLQIEFGISEVLIKTICLNLFLSMLPLHSDKPQNQLSFIYISSLIYVDLIGEK